MHTEQECLVNQRGWFRGKLELVWQENDLFSCGGLQFNYRLIGEVSVFYFLLALWFHWYAEEIRNADKVSFHILGNIARKISKEMRREEAAIKIQKNLRRQIAKKDYGKTKSSALTLQSGVRTMAARHEFRYKLTTRAATVIQVLYSLPFSYLTNSHGIILSQELERTFIQL